MGDIKDIVAAEMAKRAWNQHDLARNSGVSQPTIQRLLSGENINQRGITVKKIAAAFGITEPQLRGYAPIEQSTTTKAEEPVNVGFLLDYIKKHIDQVADFAELLGINNFRLLAIIHKLIESESSIQGLQEANVLLHEYIENLSKTLNNKPP